MALQHISIDKYFFDILSNHNCPGNSWKFICVIYLCLNSLHACMLCMFYYITDDYWNKKCFVSIIPRWYYEKSHPFKKTWLIGQPSLWTAVSQAWLSGPSRVAMISDWLLQRPSFCMYLVLSFYLNLSCLIGKWDLQNGSHHFTLWKYPLYFPSKWTRVKKQITKLKCCI